MSNIPSLKKIDSLFESIHLPKINDKQFDDFISDSFFTGCILVISFLVTLYFHENFATSFYTFTGCALASLFCFLCFRFFTDSDELQNNGTSNIDKQFIFDTLIQLDNIIPLLKKKKNIRTLKKKLEAAILQSNYQKQCFDLLLLFYRFEYKDIKKQIKRNSKKEQFNTEFSNYKNSI